MLNPSGFEQDLSQIDFKEEQKYKERDEEEEKEARESIQRPKRKESENRRVNDFQKQNEGDLPLREKELSKINNILDKFQSVTRKMASNPKTFCSDDHNSTKISAL